MRDRIYRPTALLDRQVQQLADFDVPAADMPMAALWKSETWPTFSPSCIIRELKGTTHVTTLSALLATHGHWRLHVGKPAFLFNDSQSRSSVSMPFFEGQPQYLYRHRKTRLAAIPVILAMRFLALGIFTARAIKQLIIIHTAAFSIGFSFK